MKKIIMALIVIISSINLVSADEYSEITKDTEIRYRWYKEVETGEGKYYPLKDISKTDNIDYTKVKYVGAGNVFDALYCSLPQEFYKIEEQYMNEYKKTYNASYILIENVTYNENVKIYYDNKPIRFGIISTDNNQIKINLNKEYSCDKLLFFVDTENEYTISIYRDLSFKEQIISKTIENSKLSIPDETWIDDNTYFYFYKTPAVYNESAFTKLVNKKLTCSYKEKYVYKYDVKKEYYDDNYYLNIDGYIKDVNDYKIYYKGKPIVNTVEIIQEKKVEVPKIEYVYIENETVEIDSSQPLECPENTKTETVIETKTEFVEKEIPKVPKKIYLIIIILLLVVLFLAIKLYKKYVE